MHASALLLSSTFCLNLNVRIFLIAYSSEVFLNDQISLFIDEIMSVFATSLLLLKKPIFTMDYDVVNECITYKLLSLILLLNLPTCIRLSLFSPLATLVLPLLSPFLNHLHVL